MATNGRPLRGIRNYHSKLISFHTKCFIDSANGPKNSADRRKKNYKQIVDHLQVMNLSITYANI